MQIASDNMIRDKFAGLRHHHSIHRTQIINLLEEERSHIIHMFNMMEGKIRQINGCKEADFECSNIMRLDENYCADSETTDAELSMAPEVRH